MVDVKCDLNAKYFQALIKGVAKMSIYRDPEVSVDFICKQIFGGSKTKAETDLIANIAKILQKGSFENWSPAQMSENVKKMSIKEDHGEVLQRFWMNEREKIRQSIVNNSRWNGRLEGASWRIDIKTATRAHDDMNKPVAIFEVDTRKSPSSPVDKLQFEVDDKSLTRIVKKMDDIAALIESKTKKDSE